MKKITKVGKAIAIGAVAIGLLGGGIAGATLFPKTVDVPVLDVAKYKEAVDYGYKQGIESIDIEAIQKAAYEAGVSSVEPEVVTETVVETVVKTVVDTDFQQKACDRLLYDDLNECINEVNAEDLALKSAIGFVNTEFESDIADEMEDEGIVSDEDDVSLVRVYDDYEDIEILKSDYDDNDYLFKFKVKYEDDGDKNYAYVTVSVEDGEVELEEVEE